MIPIQEIRNIIRVMEHKKKSDYAITPKIKRAIKKDTTIFTKELESHKKINRNKVVKAVESVISTLLAGPGYTYNPYTIHWASDLMAKDMLEHSYDQNSVQGILGQRWGLLGSLNGLLGNVEYCCWGQRKWDGNADEELYELQSEVSRRASSYRGRVESLVNESKILSGHLYRLRKKAPPTVVPKPDYGKHYWYGRNMNADYFRSMFPANMMEHYKSWVVAKHFVEDPGLLEVIETCKLIATSIYAMFLRGNQVILVEKPEVHLTTDVRGWGYTPHNENGPAIYFHDLKKGIYCLNGVKVPKNIVTTPGDKLDPKLMSETQNAEVRRELVRKIGIDKIFNALGGEVLDKSEDGIYELVDLKLGDTRVRPYLKMLNPSIGTWHLEGVRPGCRTVAQALEFRNGTTEQPLVLT